MTTPGAFASFVLHASRQRDELTEETNRRFAQLVPHLVRAVGIGRMLHRIEMEKATKEAGAPADPGHAGSILVDAALRIIFADEVAETLFASPSQVRSIRGTLHLTDEEANSRSQAAVASCARKQLADLPGDSIQFAVGTKQEEIIRLSVMPYRSQRATGFTGPAPVAPSSTAAHKGGPHCRSAHTLPPHQSRSRTSL